MRLVLSVLPVESRNNLLAAIAVVNGEHANVAPRVHCYYSLAAVPTMSGLRQWLPVGTTALLLTFLHSGGQMFAVIHIPSRKMLSKRGTVDLVFDSIAEDDLEFVEPDGMQSIISKMMRELPDDPETTGENN
jgi:hypothetical protein